MVYSAARTRDRRPAARSTEPALPDDDEALARRILDALAEKQAEGVVLLDIRGIASFADFFVIASATSGRQFKALSEAVNEAAGATQGRHEGSAEGGWELIDFGNVIVHVFSREDRAHYDLEGLWSKGKQLVRIE